MAQKGRTSLTQEEKDKLGNCSFSWLGIMTHIDELSAAIHTNRPMNEVSQRLHVCMNLGKENYKDNERITEGERTEMASFIENLISSNTPHGILNLEGRSREFANEIAKMLYANKYDITYRFSNPGDGSHHLTESNWGLTLVERNEYRYALKDFEYRKLPQGGNYDNGIFEIRRF